MLQKITIKNPGCQFCRYWILPLDGNQWGAGACGKGARRIFEQNTPNGQKKRWKWVDCSYTEEKNKDRTCPDFKVKSGFLDGVEDLSLKLKGGGEQMPPAYKKEMWWNDPKHNKKKDSQ